MCSSKIIRYSYFLRNNWLSTTWIIYLQLNAPEIIQLGNYEILLHNFETASPYPKKQTCLNKLFCYPQMENRFFFTFYLLV